MQDSSQLRAVLYSSDASLDAPTPGIKQDSLDALLSNKTQT